MKRFHVHVAVSDLEKSVRFYSTVFGAQPSVVKPDYAKWMLEDPHVNFAVSQRGNTPGVNHLGIQVDDAAELGELRSRLAAADPALVEEKEVACCYARSDKYWITDPAGVAWETFHTLGSVPTFSGENSCGDGASACCVAGDAPRAANGACCG